jgi:WS/DGAT/MGAT family acyltransferase
MQQLSGQDAMFLHVELDGFPMHVGGVSIHDQSTAPGGKVRFKDILDKFQRSLHKSPIFTRKLLEVPFGLDQPYWIDDPDFDLEFHLRHIALPQPGDWRQLCIQVARLHARPLDRDRPLWEAYVIEGLNNVKGVPKGSFALYLKVHHAAMDGATGVQFFGAFNDLSPRPEPEGPPPARILSPRPAAARLLGRAYLNNLRKPAQILRLLRQGSIAYRRISRGRQENRIQAIGEIPVTRFNGKVSPHRVVDACKFDFAQIRSIKGAVPGATINDVVLTIVGGAMRRYLASLGELPESSLVTSCPIDVRDESERSAGGNMIGIMNVSLRTDIAESRERLAAVHEASRSAKSYAEALGPRLGMDIADTVPAGIQSSVVRLMAAAGIAESNVMNNTMITNVPGSPCQLYLCGAETVDSFGIGPLAPGMGLFHTVNSVVMKKKGTITIAFVSCREMMPDPAFYKDCIEESFRELREDCR